MISLRALSLRLFVSAFLLYRHTLRSLRPPLRSLWWVVDARTGGAVARYRVETIARLHCLYLGGGRYLDYARPDGGVAGGQGFINGVKNKRGR